MRDYLILVGVQLKGLFGINRFFRQKGSGAGKTARAVVASLLILFAIAFFVGAAALYNYFFLADLHVSAREDLLYSAAFGFLFLILLLTYLFLTAGSLYGGKDYELLASCPVSHRTVVLSKLTGYYLIGLLITVVYMVPAMVFYALYASVSPFFYPVAVCNLLFIPMFPLAVSLVCGTAASAVSARAKRSAPVQTCMLFLFAALLFLLSFAGWRNETERTGVGVLFAGMPYGRFFGRSAASPDLLIWLCFLALSAGAFCGAFYLAAALYPRLNGRAKSRAASRRAEQRKREKSASPLSALYRRELKMVFSNPTLLINVVSAGIAAVILSAVFLFVKDLFLSDAVYRGYFVLFLPIGVSGFSALSLYGATAINVEGQELWLLKSLPVPTERKLSVKYRVSLLLSLPQTLLSMTVCAVALNVSAAECLLYFAAGILSLCAGNYAGLIVNLFKPWFDWKNRAQAAKQSLSVLLAMLLNLLLCLLLAGTAYLFSVSGVAVGLLACIFAGGALCAAGYLILYGAGVRRFEAL